MMLFLKCLLHFCHIVIKHVGILGTNYGPGTKVGFTRADAEYLSLQYVQRHYNLLWIDNFRRGYINCTLLRSSFETVIIIEIGKPYPYI